MLFPLEIQIEMRVVLKSDAGKTHRPDFSTILNVLDEHGRIVS